LGILDYIDMFHGTMNAGLKAFIIDTYKAQVSKLKELQDKESGLWHTVLTDSTSYLETSGTAAITAGILKGIRYGILDDSFFPCASKAIQGILNNIDEDDESRKQLEEIDKRRNVKTKSKSTGNKPSERQVYNDNKIINIQTCTSNDLRTLQGLSEEKTKLFIEKRNNGMMWYDIDSFAQDFELQPHEIIMLQDRLNFPIKPNVKLGRKIDI